MVVTSIKRSYRVITDGSRSHIMVTNIQGNQMIKALIRSDKLIISKFTEVTFRCLTRSPDTVLCVKLQKVTSVNLFLYRGDILRPYKWLATFIMPFNSCTQNGKHN